MKGKKLRSGYRYCLCKYCASGTFHRRWVKKCARKELRREQKKILTQELRTDNV